MNAISYAPYIYLSLSQLSAVEDIAKRVTKLKDDFPLDWTMDSDETRAYIDYVRLFQYVESLEMLLPSLKASFDRADDGSELVPTSGLDGPSLRAYSDQLRELQICRDDLLARRSTNINNSEAQRQPSIYSAQSDLLLCPTPPTGGQVAPDHQSSTNIVARKRRLGVSSSTPQKSKLQPDGGGAIMTSEVVAADILDLTGQLKASAGEVNSTLKAQTAILEKTGEEALQNVERIKREADKVVAHLTKKRRNMFATFSAMAMALASFFVVYLFIIMPFGKKRKFSSHVLPILLRSTRRNRGDGLQTQNLTDFPSDACVDGGVIIDSFENRLEEFEKIVLHKSDEVEMSIDDVFDVMTKRDPSAVGDDGDLELNFGIEVKKYPNEKSDDEVVIEPPDVVEETKTEQEESFIHFGDGGPPNVSKEEATSILNEKSEDEVIVEPPDVVEESDTEQEESFIHFGDGGPPNVSKEEETSIPNEKSDDEVVVSEGPLPHLVVEKGAEILLGSSSTDEGDLDASEGAEVEVLKGIDIHLEGTIKSNQNSDDGPVDDAASLENEKKFPTISKDENEEEEGEKIQFESHDAIVEVNNTEACVPNTANGEAPAIVVESQNAAVEFNNDESNEFDCHEPQQTVTPSTTKEERENGEDFLREGYNSNMNNDDSNDGDAMNNPIISEEEAKEGTNNILSLEKFKVEREKLQVCCSL